MKIAIGTRNPVKIQAVENSVKRVYPDEEHEFIPVSAPSGVSDQPMSDREMITGATNRATAAREELDADMGFGLEGGVMEIDGDMYLCGWVAVVDMDGKVGRACSGQMPLPPKVVAELRKRERELGDIMDELLHKDNIKQKMGTTGLLTKGLVPRTAGFETTCILALAPFYNREMYEMS